MTAAKIEVNILERGLVEHLAAPAIQRCFYGNLLNFGIQYSKGRSQSSSFMKRQKDELCSFLMASYAFDRLAQPEDEGEDVF